MTNYLLIVTIVIFACVFLSRVSNRLGIPTLLFFILLGMVFGSDGILKIPFDNYAFAEQTCSIALIFIMFYGGFGTNWNQAKSVAVKSILLSTVGVVVTSGLTGAFCHFALQIDWTESLLIGALVGSTDAASVFSILRSKKLNLKYNTASLVDSNIYCHRTGAGERGTDQSVDHKADCVWSLIWSDDRGSDHLASWQSEIYGCWV